MNDSCASEYSEYNDTDSKYAQNYSGNIRHSLLGFLIEIALNDGYNSCSHSMQSKYNIVD